MSERRWLSAMLTVALWSSACAGSEVVDGGTRPNCSVMAALERANLMAPASGSSLYVAPTDVGLIALREAIGAALRGDVERATERAGVAEYTICRGEGAERELLLFAPAVLDRGDARAIVRASGGPLVFEAPHPFFDTNTLSQSASLFETLDARALLVSGTHRCAGSSSSGCDGTTGACGTSAPYLDSDPAHAVASTFHAIHLALDEAFADTVFISVHGFGQAGVSISDGTLGPVDSGAPSTRLARALGSRISGVTSCNGGAGVPVDTRLCGSTNVQGRQLNGAANACLERPPSGLGRFIHMEQSRAVRDDVPSVVAALREAFP